jgi:hypothetical protein
MSHSRDNLLPANTWPVAPTPDAVLTKTVEETIIHRKTMSVLETYTPPKKRRVAKTKKNKRGKR